MSVSSKSKAGSGRLSTHSGRTRSASSRRDAQETAKNEPIVRYTLEDLRTKDLPDRTDWAKVTASETTVGTDDHAQPEDEIDASSGQWVRLVARRKRAISIRLDEDVIAHFKAGGAGYQSRINAVLRAHVRARRD